MPENKFRVAEFLWNKIAFRYFFVWSESCWNDFICSDKIGSSIYKFKTALLFRLQYNIINRYHTFTPVYY